MNDKILYGFFSEEAKHFAGSVIYLDTKGLPIEVTGVFESIEQGNKDYGWEDKKYVGQVIKMIVKGHEGKLKEESHAFIKKSYDYLDFNPKI